MRLSFVEKFALTSLQRVTADLTPLRNLEAHVQADKIDQHGLSTKASEQLR
jgi:hypothetical protein